MKIENIYTLGKFLCFGGVLTFLICQMWIAVLAFRKNKRDDFLCIILFPGYSVFWATRKENKDKKVVMALNCCVVAFFVGLALLLM